MLEVVFVKSHFFVYRSVAPFMLYYGVFVCEYQKDAKNDQEKQEKCCFAFIFFLPHWWQCTLCK